MSRKLFISVLNNNLIDPSLLIMLELARKVADLREKKREEKEQEKESARRAKQLRGSYSLVKLIKTESPHMANFVLIQFSKKKNVSSVTVIKF